MPRHIRRPSNSAPRRHAALVEGLVRELKDGHEGGQPTIEEEHFDTGAVRVVALWDRWRDIPEDDRSGAIIEAYRQVEGEAFVKRIALLSGLTIPEAYESGMLPFQIIPALRRGDSVTLEQCHQAMIEQGASLLFDPGRPQLRFSSEEAAEACRKRLADSLPGSEPIWQILQEVGQGVGLSWDTMD